MQLKIYCEVCGKTQKVRQPVLLRKDDLNKTPWCDLVCDECSFVVATLSADVEGELRLEPLQEEVVETGLEAVKVKRDRMKEALEYTEEWLAEGINQEGIDSILEKVRKAVKDDT